MTTLKTSQIVSYLLTILLLAVVYAMVGRLALLLAIPPGYVTAIFPSAGIAVATLLIWGWRLAPGVFLGSLTLNLWVSLEQGVIDSTGLRVALFAASGAMLQAYAGVLLVKRTIGSVITLSKEQNIILFFLLAGPVACLINASFGATGLYLNGKIALDDFAYSWFTWWVGDAIGVMITAPLVFILFGRPAQLWRSRIKTVGLPLISIMSLLILVFFWVSKWEYERTRYDFETIAKDTHEKLRASFNSYVDALSSIERFVVSSEHVSGTEFNTFVQHMLAHKPGINGLSWNPLVLYEQREAFEAAARAEGYLAFSIFEHDTFKRPVPAGERDEYIVVRYIEPLETNKKALGFDVGSNPVRLKALNQARDKGLPVATKRINLVQDNSQEAGFLLFYPVYKGASDSLEARRDNLHGFAVGVFRVADIVNAVVQKQMIYKLEELPLLFIREEGAAENEYLYASSPGEYQHTTLSWSGSLAIGGQIWQIHYQPSSAFYKTHQGWQAWAALVAGFVVVSLFSAFLLAMSGRSFYIQSLVEHRTAELKGILSSAIETILTINEAGLIKSINPAGEALLAYRREELSGRPITQVLPQFYSEEAQLTPNGPLGWRDTHALRKDKKQVDIALAVSKYLAVDQVFYTVIIHDLTERKRIDQMKNEFISTVSHELRTPLTSIKGSLSLVNSGRLDSTPDKKETLLRLAFDNCLRLERLVNDLLDFDKMNVASEIDVHYEVISLVPLIDQAISSLQGYAQHARITYTCEIDPDAHVQVKADAGRLVQVLVNLLSNAVKYSPEEGEIIIRVKRNGSSVRVMVIDHGPGIPEAFIGRVFEKFAQADSSDTRRAGGTGLGLAISKKIVEMHGGQIGFETEPGKGTCFYFDLPVVTSV